MRPFRCDTGGVWIWRCPFLHLLSRQPVHHYVTVLRGPSHCTGLMNAPRICMQSTLLLCEMCDPLISPTGVKYQKFLLFYLFIWGIFENGMGGLGPLTLGGGGHGPVWPRAGKKS